MQSYVKYTLKCLLTFLSFCFNEVIGLMDTDTHTHTHTHCGHQNMATSAFFHELNPNLPLSPF